jgi:hypothetical protein
MQTHQYAHLTLEDLELSVWEVDSYSNLTRRCTQLRKIPVSQLTAGDLRVMISQDIGTKFLVPLAIEILSKNPLVEGDFYEGDLLKSVLTVKPEFWAAHTNLKDKMFEIVRGINQGNPDLDENVCELIKAWLSK